MHANLDLILTITAGLAAALALGYGTHRLGLSPIVGYLLAGVALGPNTPGFIANRGLAEQLAEVGVILLMFGVGLHFHFRELLAVRSIAVPGAIGQSAAATLLGLLAAMSFGWGWSSGLVYGLAISVASTVVLTRVLIENNDLHTPTGHIAVGWLVVEDLLTVAVLVVLPGIAGDQNAGFSGLIKALGWSIVKIGALVAITIVVGGRVVPWLLKHVAATHSRELFTLTILVVALGIAVGSAMLFGVSMALGAFLAGMVVGRSDFSLRAAAEALPMRDAFAVLFFVATGMLFDPSDMIAAPWPIAITLAVILIGKPLAALAIVLFLGYPVRVALAVSAALAQIGEFSFILAGLGQQLKLLPPAAMNALVAAAIVSIALNPLVYRSIDAFERWAKSRPRLWARLTARTRPLLIGGPEHVEGLEAAPHRAVVIGYGPVGRTLCRLLHDNEIEPTVIEMNHDTVTTLRGQPWTTVYGDASHRETLISAGTERADSLFLSASNIHGAEEVIRQARELNPEIKVFVRLAYLKECPKLRQAGADYVFAGEGEVALAMVEFVLRDLGASPEQIDRERDRVRSDLFIGPKSSELPQC